VAAHLDHSLNFTTLIPDIPARAIDLGSGAGIPGLVLASLWPDSTWTLIEANNRRSGFLHEAATALHLQDRVEVLTDRAEQVGHAGARRGQADLVVARSFGPPAVTAECAAPLLRISGTLVVAEPPGGAADRWPEAGLAQLGLVADGVVVTPTALQRLRQESLCPPRYPRRTGIPGKRPLF
jgi:16S rRNA (guanine527-N7)-methyltransferase